jgi:hypothetical protein
MTRASLAWLLPLAAMGAQAACANAERPSPATVPAGVTPATSVAAATPVPAGPVTPAPVLVAIVVDQLAAWVAAERLPRLPRGGFARLRHEGTWVTDLAYLHAATETAPGHSALFSGSTPRETGIVANAVWRTDLDPPRDASLLEDAGYRVVNSAGIVLTTGGKEARPRPKNGVSLAKMNATGAAQPLLADRLLAWDPEAVVVALSMKDRGAAFAAGHHPTALLWFDDDAGTLVTSKPETEAMTAPAENLPAWARPFEHPAGLEGGAEWKLLDPAFIAASLPDTADDQPGEMPDLGGRTFPHLIGGPGSAKRFRATPSSDAWLADLSLAAVGKARKPDHPMLLAVSFSANDYVGHYFGPNSWEAWDELEELDATLGRLFAGLDTLLGPDGYSVVLSGDHGIVPFPLPAKPAWCGTPGGPPAPNPYEKPCQPATRLSGDEIKAYLNARLALAFGNYAMVRSVADSLVYLAPQALSGLARSRVDQVVRTDLRAMTIGGHKGLADVFAVSEFKAPCPPPADEGIPALVCRTVSDTGDYYIVPRPGDFFWGKAKTPPEGASHGTPYRYDRTVPLLVRYPHGSGDQVVETALFGSYYASAWYALTGETLAGPYGTAVGAAAMTQSPRSR